MAGRGGPEEGCRLEANVITEERQEAAARAAGSGWNRGQGWAVMCSGPRRALGGAGERPGERRALGRGGRRGSPGRRVRKST